MMQFFFLAQDAAPQAPTSGWNLAFDNIFWLTLLFVFLTAIVSAVIRLRQKDKCLKLFHDYHVTYLNIAGRASWGDLFVHAQGLELLFDAPYTTSRGLIKNGAMVYQHELGNCLALCRVIGGLTELERLDREKQVRRTFNPGILRRTWRWIRNLFNTIKDAFNKAFSAFVGQVAKLNPTSRVLTTQQGGVSEIGTTLLNSMGNAYEPMLERHIGKPVILELASPADPTKKIVEFPGYLVDYTEKFVAIFNVEHVPLENIELELSESHEQSGLRVTMEDRTVTVICTGSAALIVERIECGERINDLVVTLTNGASVGLPRTPGLPVKLTLQRSRQIDIVCPRNQGQIRFASQDPKAKHRERRNWFGLAPQMEEDDEREGKAN